MKEIVVIEETWGLGITRTETLKVKDKDEERFFEELIEKYKKVQISNYPRIVKEYKLKKT